MSEFESLTWPLEMMFPFVNVRNVMNNILGWGSAMKGRLLVLAGGEDKLMSPKLMRRMAEQYCQGFEMLSRSKPLGPRVDSLPLDKIADGEEIFSGPVRFGIVKGAGHHFQNDLQWEDGASQVLTFIEQL